MSLLSSIIEKFEGSYTKNNPIVDANLYKLLFDYYTSLDVVNDYQQAVEQLDTTSLSENYQWLLFTGFNVLINSIYYNDEHRDKLCQFWLPKYEYILKELLSIRSVQSFEIHTNHLRLNAIKYLIINMVEMQLTFESSIHLLKIYTQFQNFSQKDEYLTIIKLISQLLINKHILKGIKNDDYTNIKLEWKSNNISNTINITPTLIFWYILKLIIIFIKTDDDCLTAIKHDTNIKEILLKSMRKIKDNHPIKLSAYAVLTLLVNEEDIKNEIKDPNEIITLLVDSANQSIDNGDLYSKVSSQGVHITDLMVALKGMFS